MVVNWSTIRYDAYESRQSTSAQKTSTLLTSIIRRRPKEDTIEDFNGSNGFNGYNGLVKCKLKQFLPVQRVVSDFKAVLASVD